MDDPYAPPMFDKLPVVSDEALLAWTLESDGGEDGMDNGNKGDNEESEE